MINDTLQLDTRQETATSLDQNDPLSSYRDKFHFPLHQGKPVLYFCGNSLGLQPKTVEKYLREELSHWAEHGVEGHFKGARPWMYYHKFFSEKAARLVGALPQEVVIMNSLTTNLHLMMVSFYRPQGKRTKILMEGGAFPSDQYAMESQVRFHGLDPDEHIIEVHPKQGEHYLKTEDILQVIEENREEIALVMFAGVNYYTGQFFDLEAITKAGHAAGANVGFDLAHAAGNLPLQLHDWGADFAVWCSYKYLNSGPGGPSGAFIHERHAKNADLPRFAGWWGHDEGERFQMKKGFIPMHGAAGWQLSNAQIIAMAPHLASLEIFDEVGMPALRRKSLLLTDYLEFLMESLNEETHRVLIITPREHKDRGCQLSMLTGEWGSQLYEHLKENGVICDWREPNVIRLAPVPLYNSFQDIYDFYQLLKNWIDQNL